MPRPRRTRRIVPALVAAVILAAIGLAAVPSPSSAHWYIKTHAVAHSHWFGGGGGGGGHA